MKKPETTKRLLYLITIVRVALDRIEDECGPQPKFSEATFEERDGWWRKREAAFAVARKRLEEEGAAFSHKAAHDHFIRLAGIRSSSTGGWGGAFNNWIRAAEKRVAEQTAASHERA